MDGWRSTHSPIGSTSRRDAGMSRQAPEGRARPPGGRPAALRLSRDQRSGQPSPMKSSMQAPGNAVDDHLRRSEAGEQRRHLTGRNLNRFGAQALVKSVAKWDRHTDGLDFQEKDRTV